MYSVNNIHTGLQLPGVEHHERKVGVVIDRRGDTGIVFFELVQRQIAIRIRIKSVEELLKNLIDRLLARNDLGVLAGIVNLLNVIQADIAVAGDVELLVRASNQLLAVFVQLATESSQKLVERDAPICGLVILLENQVDLPLCQTQPVISKSLLEFLLVKLLVSVVIVDSKSTTDLEDAKLAAALDGVLDLLVNGVVRAHVYWWMLD